MAEAVGATDRPAGTLHRPRTRRRESGHRPARRRADSAPVIAIVGQVRREVRGREAFQEMDVVGLRADREVGGGAEGPGEVPLMER
jgi:hypothetical protein